MPRCRRLSAYHPGISRAPQAGRFRRWGPFEIFLSYFFDNFFVSSFRDSGQLVIGLPESSPYSFTISMFWSFCFVFLSRGFSQFYLNPSIEFFLLAVIFFNSKLLFFFFLFSLFLCLSMLCFVCWWTHFSYVFQYSFEVLFPLCFLFLPIPYCCLFGSLDIHGFFRRWGVYFYLRVRYRRAHLETLCMSACPELHSWLAGIQGLA